MKFCRFLLAILACLSVRAWAQEPELASPSLHLLSSVSVTGNLERGRNSDLWLRTPEGARLLMNEHLNFSDAHHQITDFASLQPGTEVTAEIPAGDARLLGVNGQVATLLMGGRPTQLPVSVLAASSRADSRVVVRYANGSAATLPLGEALRLQQEGQASIALPEVGLATLLTPTGPVQVNLKPDVVFNQPYHAFCTVQRKLDRASGQELELVTSNGDILQVPVSLVKVPGFGQVRVEERVDVNIPAGRYQLVEMFGRQAQLYSPQGVRLQFPFKLFPDEALATRVWVRNFAGEVHPVSLEQALRNEKSRDYTILLPGAPGINPSEVSGFYEVKVK